MVGPFPLGFLVATLIAGLLVALLAFLVGLVLMRLSGHYVAVATLGFLIIVRVTLFNADAFTRGSRTFSNITAYTDLWWVYALGVRPSMSSGASSFQLMGAACLPNARIAGRHSRSASP